MMLLFNEENTVERTAETAVLVAVVGALVTGLGTLDHRSVESYSAKGKEFHSSPMTIWMAC